MKPVTCGLLLELHAAYHGIIDRRSREVTVSGKDAAALARLAFLMLQHVKHCAECRGVETSMFLCAETC
jgi:hypothetical protein